LRRRSVEAEPRLPSAGVIDCDISLQSGKPRYIIALRGGTRWLSLQPSGKKTGSRIVRYSHLPWARRYRSCPEASTHRSRTHVAVLADHVGFRFETLRVPLFPQKGWSP